MTNRRKKMQKMKKEQKENGKQKRRPLKIIIPLIFIIAGIGLAAYPIIGRIINQYNAEKIIAEYNEKIDTYSEDELQELKDDISRYNETGDTRYYTAANEEGIIGYIEIPTIDVYLPIYDNTEDATLDMGIGHVTETSIPNGDKGTHCMLTGHSGLTTQKMFTDLQELNTGDTFIIHILGDKVTYEVYDIDTVEPSEVMDCITYDHNECYCTLMTCTPIGVNTHRLLVHGKCVSVEAE